MRKRSRPVEMSLELDFQDERVAQAIYKALEVEIGSASRRKAVLTAELKGRFILIRIAASSSSSMRAISNSYLRWIYSISETLGELRET